MDRWFCAFVEESCPTLTMHKMPFKPRFWCWLARLEAYGFTTRSALGFTRWLTEPRSVPGRRPPGETDWNGTRSSKKLSSMRSIPWTNWGKSSMRKSNDFPNAIEPPLILCDLEGRTHEQAARHLGWPIGTVKSRQSRGRERLVHRGHASSAGMMLAALKPKVLTTLLPPALIDETAHAAVHSLTIRTITNGSSAALAREVLRSMSLLRWWKAATFFIAAVATVSGAAVFAQKEKAKPADDPIPAAAALNPPVIVVKPGKLILAERGSLEAIPTAAVLSREGKTVVALKTPEGGFSWREVTIGGNDMKRFEIVHGLHEGDVVVENASLLKDRNAEKDKEPSKP